MFKSFLYLHPYAICFFRTDNRKVMSFLFYFTENQKLNFCYIFSLTFLQKEKPSLIPFSVLEKKKRK